MVRIRLERQLPTGAWQLVMDFPCDAPHEKILEDNHRWYPTATFRMVRATTTYEVM